jgi:uncharacterized membrane protein
MPLLGLMLYCVGLTSCVTSSPPIAIKGTDYDEWQGHVGGICLSESYAKTYLHWKNHK